MLFINGALGAQSVPVIPCGDRGKIVDQLQTVYAEEPVSIGIMANGSVIEVYASDDDTFTVLITSPTGATCLVASGNSWENIDPPLKGTDM